MCPRPSLHVCLSHKVIIAACAGVLLWTGTTLAQAPAPTDTRTVLDLKYTVQDLGGKVQDLQIKETDTEIRIELAADVLFDFDKADLRPSAQEALNPASAVIREKGGKTIRVEGHTDAKGSAVYNQQLSVRRAESVKSWLASAGGLGDRTISTQGLGATRPIAPNTKPDGSDDPDGRQKNRRVEILVGKK